MGKNQTNSLSLPSLCLSPLHINSAEPFHGKATHPLEQPGIARKRVPGVWREPGLVPISRRGGPEAGWPAASCPRLTTRSAQHSRLFIVVLGETSGCRRRVSARCVSTAEAIMTFLYKVWVAGSVPCL